MRKRVGGRDVDLYTQSCMIVVRGVKVSHASVTQHTRANCN